MLARVCFILAILFVAACAAAYPLTWGRWGSVLYIGANWGIEASVEHGRGYFATVWGKPPPMEPGFQCLGWQPRPANDGDLRRGQEYTRAVQPYPGGDGFFPLWMPAV